VTSDRPPEPEMRSRPVANPWPAPDAASVPVNGAAAPTLQGLQHQATELLHDLDALIQRWQPVLVALQDVPCITSVDRMLFDSLSRAVHRKAQLTQSLLGTLVHYLEYPLRIGTANLGSSDSPR
jgi:hypothetical protein